MVVPIPAETGLAGAQARERAGQRREQLRSAARGLGRARAHALSVATAIALAGGIAFPVFAIRHLEGLRRSGDDEVGALLGGRWPSGWGTVLETPAQHAGVLASRDLLACFGALAVGIACATIAALVLSRAAARRREVAVRAAVGAAPATVLGEIALEGVLLGAMALAALATLALAAGAALALSRPELLRAWLTLRPGLASIGGAIVAPVAALLLFAPLAALPAASSRLARALGMARATPPPYEGSLRRALAIAQLTTALSLLVGAGLLLRGARAQHARETQGGEGALERTAPVRIIPVAGPGIAGTLGALRASPGVSAASASSPGAWLGQGAEGTLMFTCPRCRIGSFGTPIVGKVAQHQLVAPGFFAALGIAAAHGRELQPGDADTAHVAVINRSFEALFQGTVDPIGQWIRIGSNGEWYRIVGIVPDVRPPGVGASLGALATVYLPLSSRPSGSVDMVLREASPGSPGAEGGPLQGGVTLEAALDRLAAPLRWFGVATLALSLVVLLLALHGVAVVAIDDVRRRRRELAIRAALGAPPWRIMASVVGRGLVHVGVGAAWASGGVMIVVWLLERVSPSIPGFDVRVYSGALALVTLVSLAASLYAVRAALRVEAREALAEE